MANKMEDKVLEALSGLVPAESSEKVASVLTALLDEAVAEVGEKIAEQKNAELTEAYKTIKEEREQDWETVRKGYGQAYDIINYLRGRISRQDREIDAMLKEEYEAAYQMILAERSKNENLEKAILEQAEADHQKDFEKLVDMVDVFLDKEMGGLQESIRLELLNDPYLAEHRVAFDRVVDVVKDYVDEDNMLRNTNNKVTELERKVEAAEAVTRQLKDKNTRLMTENNQVKSYLKQTKELIEQSMLNEQKERVEKASKVEGRGQIADQPERLVVIGEAVDRTTTSDTKNAERNVLNEWQVLAGLAKVD